MKVKAGICVAYDWGYLRVSLPAIYKAVDSICLSVDAEFKSWNGNLFTFEWDEFLKMVESIDVDKKIQILKEPFYNKNKTPIENECYQRRRMAESLGAADWIVQIDADEIIINPDDFISCLKKFKNVKRPVNIHGIWINLIKQTGAGFIYSIMKTPPLASNKPVYEYGRTNGHFNIYVNAFLAHITWARPEAEVHYKLMNWGHSHEFNGASFFKIWQALDDYNWTYIKDFHPVGKAKLPQLFFQKSANLEEFIQSFNCQEHALSGKDLLANNIWISRLKKYLKFSA